MFPAGAGYQVTAKDMSDKHGQFMHLFLRYQPRLYAMIRTQIFNRADAEDVMQEVATVLWQRFDDYESGTHFDRWALRITKLQILKYYEKRRHQRMVFDADVVELIFQEAETAGGNIDEVREALDHCLGKLKQNDRAVIKMRYEGDATNRAVAQRLGKSDSAISRALNRIHGLLMRCIQAQLSTQHNTISEQHRGNNR